MSDYFTNKRKEALSFKQIALEHYQRILELTAIEFRGGYENTIYQGSAVHRVYIPDSRAQFSQAVDALALALFPHFDKGMEEAYEKYHKHKEELVGKYADQEGFFSNSVAENNSVRYSIRMMSVVKQLFRDISCLMYRLDYFKTATYTESDLEEENILDMDGTGEEKK